MMVPAQPTTAHFQACGPRLIRNSETIWRLPGGQVAGEIGDEIEEVGVASQAAGCDGDCEEQSRKEC